QEERLSDSVPDVGRAVPVRAIRHAVARTVVRLLHADLEDVVARCRIAWGAKREPISQRGAEDVTGARDQLRHTVSAVSRVLAEVDRIGRRVRVGPIDECATSVRLLLPGGPVRSGTE